MAASYGARGFAIALGFILLGSTPLWAQSGSRTYQPSQSSRSRDSRTSTSDGSGTVTTPRITETRALAAPTKLPPLALDGHCAVCLVEMTKLVRGDRKYFSIYDGNTYLFPGADQKKMFDATPQKYAPALGGDCTVCLVESGKRMPGRPQFFSIYDDRLYRFAGEDQKKMFDAEPQKYAEADLAMDGKCPVCLVEMRKWIDGSPRMVADVNGRRYRFADEKQRQKFLNDSAKYVPVLDGNCAVCKVEMGQDTPGKPPFGAYYKNRFFLFPNDDMRGMFMKNYDKYADTDVALGGKCPVCRVDLRQDVKGNWEFASVYKGKRYLFPGDSQRRRFLADPEKYAVGANIKQEGSGAK